MRTYVYYPKGVCSRRYEIDLEDGIIRDLRIEAGCDGNLQGISKLVVGRPALEIAALLKGVRCESKRTSCPDQIALALLEAVGSWSGEGAAGA